MPKANVDYKDLNRKKSYRKNPVVNYRWTIINVLHS